MKSVWGRSLLLITLLGSQAELADEHPDFPIFECGQIFGPETTYESLVEIFGVDKLADRKLYLPEGFVDEGTVIFPDTPDEVEIFWIDPETRHAPERIRITQGPNSWITRDGLSLELDLQSVEKLNRFPFRLLGFGWDYSGTVMSWGNGDLNDQPFPGCRRIVRFGADYSKIPWEVVVENGDVLGSREFSSGHPTMQLMNPTIREILLLMR